VINWSIVGVLDLSVAHCDLHELASLVVLALVVLWELGSGLSEFVKVVLAFGTDHVVGGDFLLHSSELDVLVHGGLSDWDHSVNQVPKDTFDEWGGSQGSLIGESLVEVDQLHKLAEVKRTLLSDRVCVHHHLFVLLLVNQSGQKLVVI
jgi:hypothetical protein